MTNKMPMVGRRYKLRNQFGKGNGEIVIVVSVDKDFSCKLYLEKRGDVCSDPLPLASFCNICEELAEDNLQETEKEPTTEPKWLPMSCAPKCGSPITVKQSTNKRHKIFKANWFLNKWYSLYEEGGNEEVQPEFWLEGSKEEPKIDIKEEHIEPVSIWKNGDELEELEKRNEKFLIRTKDGRVTMPFLSNIFFNDRQIDKNIKEATTLTDFVNSIEQMQKDIEELKQK